MPENESIISISLLKNLLYIKDLPFSRCRKAVTPIMHIFTTGGYVILLQTALYHLYIKMSSLGIIRANCRVKS